MTKAFTLIEIIMYLALFSLLIGGVVSASFAFEESSENTVARALLNEEELFIINKISSDTSNATDAKITTFVSHNFIISPLIVSNTARTYTAPETLTVSFHIKTQSRSGKKIEDNVSQTFYPHHYEN